MPQVWIEGLQSAQRRMLDLLRKAKGKTPAAAAVRAAAIVTHWEAVVRTHVDTGALRASHRVYLRKGGLRAIITPDPEARNPHGQRPAVYGLYEEQRGGSHAFYRRTIREGARAIWLAARDAAKRKIARGAK